MLLAMHRALAYRLAGLAVLLVAAALAWEAWQRVAPAVEDGWIGPGMAARVLLPPLLLAAFAVWLARR